jgi:NAD(P)-dependent dehydrogenase (short-subunit alcohol dehydrogenase family)
MSRKRWTTENMQDQTGRVAIVTGANSGIGFEAAKALAIKGATVVVASRSKGRGEQAVASIREAAPDANVELMLLDLASLDSVRGFVAAFRDRFDRLDLLINNAGVMMPPERQETADGFELQIGTNHLGHFALTLPLLDLLLGTEGSRVVNVSSSAQNFGKLDLDDLQWTKRSFDRMGSYGASKIANMLFTLELQRRFDEAGASTIATACHPGWTATNLQKTSPVIRMLNPVFGMKPWQGALPTLYAAVSPDAVGSGYYGPDGIGTWRGYPAPNRPAAPSTDAEAARRLWELSEQAVGITTPQI